MSGHGKGLEVDTVNMSGHGKGLDIQLTCLVMARD